MTRWSVFFLLVACSASAPTSFATSFAAAQRSTLAGRYSEAVTLFEHAAEVAKTPRDREEASYRAALARIRSGDVSTGTLGLARVAFGDGDFAADAALLHAELLLKVKEVGAAHELDAFVRRFPQNGLAPRALALRLRLEDEKGANASLTYLATLEQPLAETELCANVVYEEGRRLENTKNFSEAHAHYLAVATRWPYPHGALFDDALWRAADSAEQLGRPDLAAEDLERMVGVHEESYFTGSYDRPRFPDAMLRLARIYETSLHDKTRALETYRRFVNTFTRSAKLDFALWNEARILAENSDKTSSCKPLSTLVDRFPDSRYVPCVLERCAEITRPKPSRAPTKCHAYIERGDDGPRTQTD